MLSILAVGGDVRLLVTRAAVLRRTGADVVAAGPQVACELLDTMTFDVVVLCHSLNRFEVEGVVVATSQSDPETRVVQVVPNAGSRSDYEGTGVDHVTTARPSALLEKVLQLLSAVERTGADIGVKPDAGLASCMIAGCLGVGELNMVRDVELTIPKIV